MCEEKKVGEKITCRGLELNLRPSNNVFNASNESFEWVIRTHYSRVAGYFHPVFCHHIYITLRSKNFPYTFVGIIVC